MRAAPAEGRESRGGGRPGRLAWAVARLPVSLLVAGVRRVRVLPVAPGERPPRLPPPAMIRLGFGTLEGIAAVAARRLDDPQGRWLELHNKLLAFGEFRRAAESATAADVFGDLWRREGKGYLLGRCAAAGHGAVAPELLPADQLPCHTGLGLGLASFHLEGLGEAAPEADVERAIERFLADSRRLAMTGYAGAVVEALGLTVRLSHPELLGRVDGALARRSARCRSLFWHGVGRGLYFDSREMPPAAAGTWGAVRLALDLAPDEEARRNVVAGLAWAATLVNFCAPRIVAARLQDGLLGAAGDAAANGVASVTLLWLHAVGDGPLLRAFTGYWADGQAAAAEPWRRRLEATIALALDRIYPLLAEQTRIDELFRYRPVEGWEQSLREETGRGGTRCEEVPAHG